MASALDCLLVWNGQDKNRNHFDEQDYIKAECEKYKKQEIKIAPLLWIQSKTTQFESKKCVCIKSLS